jgi:hypothetical protein
VTSAAGVNGIDTGTIPVYSNVLVSCANMINDAPGLIEGLSGLCGATTHDAAGYCLESGEDQRFGGDLTSTEATVNRIILAAFFLTTLALAKAEATGLVNTEAGTFSCQGTIVRLDSKGVPSSGEPGGKMKPCHQLVEVKDTI